MMSDSARTEIIDLANIGGSFGKKIYSLMDANGNFQPHKLRVNDMMPQEAWKAIDTTVQQEVQLRLNGVADLMSRGLVHDMRSVGMGKSVLQWQDQSDIGPAEIGMDPSADATRDKSRFSTMLLPLFITHKDVSFNYRELKEAQAGGYAIDTSNIALASRKVAEGVEDLLFNGPSQAILLPTAWGNALAYGYRTIPSRNTGSLAASWATATTAQIKADLLAMKGAAIGQRMYGPYVLYIPTSYEQRMDDDYVTTTATVTTIRQRLMAFGNIEAIKVCDFLPTDNVLLIQMDRSVVDLVIAVDPMVIPWEEKGGMKQNYKVLTIMVPRLKATYASRSGIIHRVFP